MTFDGISNRWKVWRDRLPLDEYEERFAKMASDGENVHGEVDALDRLRSAHWPIAREAGARSVFDAGCGTGRASLELAARGWSVTAADSDPDMIALAKVKSTEIDWHHGDLSDISLANKFDLVLMAGNILLFVHEGTEETIMANMASHLAADGLLVAGFGLREFSLEQYESWCQNAGLVVVEQWSTWDGDPYQHGGDYIVSIHQLAD